ncbi:MAG: transcriptional repressor LexA [Candidatus Gracilibacteria bacterium]|nr:transcriptional repressor LexA [Candidatus Gracilibacteria bacterium]
METKSLTPREADALREIRSAVRLLGKFPSVRELMVALGYRSPRSAAVLMKELEKKGFLRRTPGGKLCLSAQGEDVGGTDTIELPVVGQARCGVPTFAEESVDEFVRVSTDLAPRDRKHFLLRAQGDSMDQAGIQPGDLVLIRVQDTAQNGDRVLALIDDEATIKEFERRGEVVILHPRSSNPEHRPIVVSENLKVQGIVVTAIPAF